MQQPISWERSSEAKYEEEEEDNFWNRKILSFFCPFCWLRFRQYCAKRKTYLKMTKERNWISSFCSFNWTCVLGHRILLKPFLATIKVDWRQYKFLKVVNQGIILRCYSKHLWVCKLVNKFEPVTNHLHGSKIVNLNTSVVLPNF